jgi:hypothetical protein
MKIAFKYALIPTLTIILWIVIVRLVMGVDPESKLNIVGPILFNIAQIIAIYLGVSKRKREPGALTFGQGVQTGFLISLVYATLAVLFFMFELLVGPNLLPVEPGAQSRPMWQTAAMAFAGLFFGAIFLGLIYSVIISLILRTRAD